MCSDFRTGNTSHMIGYTYPTLHKGVRWYVDFYCFDPATKQMRRKRYYLGKFKSTAEKKRRGAEIIEVLTRQLMQGWNPFVKTEEDSRGFVKFSDCIERYLGYVDRMDRKKTRDSYHSRVNVLNEYINTLPVPITYVYQFDESFCNDFIDWIFLDRESSPRTRNNYRGWLFSFAEFMVARKYLKYNPVEKIKNLPENEKYRKDLTPEMLEQMTAHLLQVDKPFYLACMMQYYTLIRPGELSHLKVKNISVMKQSVFVSKEFSKNHKDAEVGLNKTIIKLMLDLGVLTKPGEYYLFGENFLPSEKRGYGDQFNKRWKIMRKALGWKDCYQFYSLKDSGIRDLANSQGVVVARDQARHSDVATTNKYIQNHGVQDETLNFEGNLTYTRGHVAKDKLNQEDDED